MPTYRPAQKVDYGTDEFRHRLILHFGTAPSNVLRDEKTFLATGKPAKVQRKPAKKSK